MATRPAYLIDTNVLIWSGDNPDRISPGALSALTNPRATIRYSLTSVWEMQIKHALGKLPLPGEAHVVAARYAAAIGAEFLPITCDHIGTLYQLPKLHGDPFDRMLLAQALHEKLVFVCPDRAIQRYPITTLW